MNVNANTPVIVGVGQFTERIDAPDYQALSAPDVAARAVLTALNDALPGGNLAAHVDTIATTRTFEDSTPMRAHPFGKSNNFPHSIAKRVGIHPRLAVWEKAGGNSPQQLISEFCGRIATGELGIVLIAGAENISTARHLKVTGEHPDWHEEVEGDVENRGLGLKGMISQYEMSHGLVGAPPSYALAENARRGRLGLDRKSYAQTMADLFAPFTRVASANPYSSFGVRETDADQLIEVGEHNRMIAEPYPLKLVARDQVNQGAAVLLTSVGKARELGIPSEKWVYLHGHSNVTEKPLLEREDIGASPAAQMASRAALSAAEIDVSDVRFFDFYSCFPIAVSNAACDGLGLSNDDPRGLTVTGGLPYFGGPGNNYSMHAVASMVERLRGEPESFGFIGANGGMLSKYSAAVYSTKPAPWKERDDRALQARLDAAPRPAISHEADGAGIVETYTTVFERGRAAYSVVVGRLQATGERFLAMTEKGDDVTLQAMLRDDPLGKSIYVRSTPKGNRFAFDEARIATLFPERKPMFRDTYEYLQVERTGHVLQVTINRPDVRNCLHPMANDELDEVFDAYEADSDLWVAILTGAGGESFCAGNDLKYTASGGPMWMPKGGFGGITSRDRTKPVIAAVNGFAMGGGTEICLACDIVVADTNAQFALSEVRVGLFAGAGGLVRLPRQLPKKVATELILTGRRIAAPEAASYGFVSRVTPAGEALAAAQEVAAEIVEASPTSVRLSLRVMRDAELYASELDAVRHRNPKIVDELLTSEDFMEGPMAFAQKRKPVWKNR
jgi:acetyl-CoA C-acetyltransferase